MLNVQGNKLFKGNFESLTSYDIKVHIFIEVLVVSTIFRCCMSQINNIVQCSAPQSVQKEF